MNRRGVWRSLCGGLANGLGVLAAAVRGPSGLRFSLYLLPLVACGFAFGTPADAAPVAPAAVSNVQDLSGDWQGTIKQGGGVRLLVHVAKVEGQWVGMLYAVDQSPDGFRLDSLALDGATVKFSFAALGVKYSGTLNPAGDSIAGTWTQGGAVPLDFQRATSTTLWKQDASPHKISFVAVDEHVALEVLDWGGSGRPVVLLAGLGNTAHVFDDLAPKLAKHYHVYGITRRGFGLSAAPEFNRRNYAADRLGDDVLAVMTSLKIDRPVLIGHSIAGAELSSIGSRHPERVAGLVYLEAGYSQAFYDPARGDLLLDADELSAKLDRIAAGGAPDPRALYQDILKNSLPALQKDLQRQLEILPPTPPGGIQPLQGPSASSSILGGLQKYTTVPVPMLAIYALPHDLGGGAPKDPAARAALEASDLATTGEQARSFQTVFPKARVVTIAHANHYVFRSNEADVLREVTGFIDRLDTPASKANPAH